MKKLFNLINKNFRFGPIIFSLALIVCFEILFSASILAAPTLPPNQQYGNQMGDSWQIPTVEQTQTEAFSGELNGPAYSSAWLGWLFGNMGHYMLGPVNIQPQGPGLQVDRGAVGVFGSLIAGMTAQPPVHTANYIADLGQSLGLATPAYAQQGTGFKALEPVLPIWKAFRNIAYFGFVVIFVVIGFMIMFRAKINPQTVISIQAALPQIIITLLLITFSYAIAALMIDLIYLLIYFVVGIFKAFGLITDSEIAINALTGKNVFEIALRDLISPSRTEAAGSAANAVLSAVGGVFGKTVEVIARILQAKSLAYVIFGGAILIAVWKLFFQLLMAYVGIIFAVIFAPISLLFNALPGSQSFGKWLKGLLANVLVFPVTAIMFLIAAMLLGSPHFGVNDQLGYSYKVVSGAWDAPFNDYSSLALPFVGGGLPAESIFAIIGIGFLMMMPKIIEILQKMLGVEGGVAGMAGAALAGVVEPYNKYQQFTGWQNKRMSEELSKQQLLSYTEGGSIPLQYIGGHGLGIKDFISLSAIRRIVGSGKKKGWG